MQICVGVLQVGNNVLDAHLDRGFKIIVKIYHVIYFKAFYGIEDRPFGA